MSTGTALVVDDDAVSRLVLRHMLRRLDWVVEEAADTPDAIARLASSRFDLVISDVHLPSGTGVDILDAAERSDGPPRVVLVTGFIEYSSLSSDITSRLSGQLTKPVSSEALRGVLVRSFPEGATD